MAVDEGDRVAAGQWSRRSTSKAIRRRAPHRPRALDERAADLAKLEHGSRPEEIAQARANVDLARSAAEINQ